MEYTAKRKLIKRLFYIFFPAFRISFKIMYKNMTFGSNIHLNTSSTDPGVHTFIITLKSVSVCV